MLTNLILGIFTLAFSSNRVKLEKRNGIPNKGWGYASLFIFFLSNGVPSWERSGIRSLPTTIGETQQNLTSSLEA